MHVRIEVIGTEGVTEIKIGVSEIEYNFLRRLEAEIEKETDSSGFDPTIRIEKLLD